MISFSRTTLDIFDDYHMTRVKISGENGCWEMCDFPTLSQPHSHGQEPIHVEKSHQSQLSNHQGSRNHSASGLVVTGPQWSSCWELGNFSMGMGSCYKTKHCCGDDAVIMLLLVESGII